MHAQKAEQTFFFFFLREPHGARCSQCHSHFSPSLRPFIFHFCRPLPVAYSPSFTAFPSPVFTLSLSLTATSHLCVSLFTGQDVRLPLLPLPLLFLAGGASALFTFNQRQTSEGTVAFFFFALLSNFQNGKFTPIIPPSFVRRRLTSPSFLLRSALLPFYSARIHSFILWGSFFNFTDFRVY